MSDTADVTSGEYSVAATDTETAPWVLRVDSVDLEDGDDGPRELKGADQDIERVLRTLLPAAIAREMRQASGRITLPVRIDLAELAKVATGLDESFRGRLTRHINLHIERVICAKQEQVCEVARAVALEQTIPLYRHLVMWRAISLLALLGCVVLSVAVVW